METSQQVDLMKLPLDQLEAVKVQMEEELQQLNISYSQLKYAMDRFTESKNFIDNMFHAGNNKKDMLIPLTNSLYVPGKLHVDTVTIDIGTGYYAEMTGDKANSYFERQLDFTKKNMAKIESLFSSRGRNLEILVNILNFKANNSAIERGNAQPASKS